jgi:hypothetical protein
MMRELHDNSAVLSVGARIAPTLMSVAAELSHRFGGGRATGVHNSEEGAHDAA